MAYIDIDNKLVGSKQWNISSLMQKLQCQLYAYFPSLGFISILCEGWIVWLLGTKIKTDTL